MRDVGIVVIGRNEGERLRCCLKSVIGRSGTVVYVDSGSTDESVASARAIGAEVVALDMTIPFTAARARIAGVARLLDGDPGVRFVQFGDGDCEVVAGWLECARGEFEGRDDLTAVCGRIRERFPERTLYNRLADLEWDVPAGEVTKCGGLAMMRVEAYRQAGGFRESLIAGEEGELCLRLRRHGGRIVRIADEMALHDMEMTRFRQWWRRTVRTGHAYAEGYVLNGRGPERYCWREVRSLAFWGLLLPLASVLLALPTRGASLILIAAYPLLAIRIARGASRRGFSRSHARCYALFCVLGKFAQALGMVRYAIGRLRGRRSRLIEDKGVPRPPHRARKANAEAADVHPGTPGSLAEE